MTEAGIADLVAKMTLEEKASLCSGRDFWTTKPVERLGIQSWLMTDGPHGLRKQSAANDHIGLNHSVPATCFPTAVGLGASWNRPLLKELGQALGRECQANDVGTILGPGVNIKRSPLCGRNFEYFSEDPLLAGELAASHIDGVQSQGVGTSLKHFAANNQERLRMTIDTLVDERTLREIYLPAFETAVKKSKPWTVRCAYNKLNGTYCSENSWLLTRVLRDEWGYDGIVVTDWGASNDRVAGLVAGTDLEMPASGGMTDRAIVEAVQGGALDESVLDEAVIRNLRLYFRVTENRKTGTGFDADAHHALARTIAGECIVLLKNDDSLLPLDAKGRIAFIGAFAKNPRYQGGGSSHINPTRIDCAWDEASRFLAGEVGKTGEAGKAGESGNVALAYAAGYDLAKDETIDSLRDEAVALAAASDVAVLFIGLTEQYESEGYDRSHIRLPAAHIELLESVAAVQKKLVVVLSNGAPVEMPWLDRAGAVLESYLGGQAGGSAVVDVLFGKVNPSGRLAETFPARLQDNPSWLHFPGGHDAVEYREGPFVGYRYYESADVSPLFPFGYGLSYTRFEYGNLEIDKAAIRDDETLKVSVTVRNAGGARGKEVVQLYVGEIHPDVVRPVRELKGFEKIDLAPGESGAVHFVLDRRAFAHWDTATSDWLAGDGDFEIQIGASSHDIRLRAKVRLSQANPRARVYSQNSTIGETVDHPSAGIFISKIRDNMLQVFGDFESGSPKAIMAAAMVNEMPLRNLTMLSSEKMPGGMIATLVEVLNGMQPPEVLRPLS
ncbi:MAG: glycoside hydrolase family 3 C-terminal domain-containing protein [Rectinemataceae bacterium]|nr:glycoside hydrolase family 3 C-terminal domain-containing protein [Rectinemataceae bacterium]